MKNNFNLFWLAFYFGQSCIIHPHTGRWILCGFFNNQIICTKYENEIEVDSMFYPIEEIQFILKFYNPYLIRALCKFPNSYNYIKNKAMEGYWMFPDEDFNQIIFEK